MLGALQDGDALASRQGGFQKISNHDLTDSEMYKNKTSQELVEHGARRPGLPLSYLVLVL